VTVVLLAAGKSTRTSGMKPLYRIGKDLLINRQIRKLRAYGYDVAVVLGHAYEKIRAVLDPGVTVIRNEGYEAGMFSSVKKAFEALDAPELYFCHVDRPVPDKSVFEALSRSRSPVAVAFYEGRRAPPVRISAEMKADLLASGATRLDQWVLASGVADFVAVDDPKVLQNANTDEELKRYFG
jgi:CTP:molybdopterin cytidylyltransferase MocA